MGFVHVKVMLAGLYVRNIFLASKIGSYVNRLERYHTCKKDKVGLTHERGICT
jgi:hypothetical protein